MKQSAPYCGDDVEIDYVGYGFEEDETYEQWCERCDKTFAYTASISYTYYPHKADCLNGGEHRYKLRLSSYLDFSKMGCEDCGHRRQLTEEEFKELKDEG